MKNRPNPPPFLLSLSKQNKTYFFICSLDFLINRISFLFSLPFPFPGKKDKKRQKKKESCRDLLDLGLDPQKTLLL